MGIRTRLVRHLALWFVAVALLTSLAAGAWTRKVKLGVSVHNHQFWETWVQGDECTAQITLRFRAPEAGYQARSKVANYYRFKARLELDNGREIESRIFFNRKPGARMYRFDHDTTADGCWAKKRRSLRRLNVDACRGKGCTPKGS